MKDKYQKQWETLGATDPYWAVLTEPKMKGGKWNQDDFFKTGENEIHSVLSKIERLDVTINKNIALDFGCGVGRLSKALSSRFDKVIGVDISNTMLHEAKKINQEIKNIEFIHNSAKDLKIIPSNSIDFIYSNMVLQHMPRNSQISYLEEFCRVLSKDGLIAFQTPSKHKLNSIKSWVYMLLGNNLLNFFRKFKYGSNGVMEVHTLPKELVINILKENNLNIRKIERFDSAGSMFESYIYIAEQAVENG